MIEVGTNPRRKSWLPDTSHGFWRICLLASLMINLVVLGLLLGHRFNRNPMDHAGAANYAQFVPPRFFAELPGDRRKELVGAFRANKQDFDKLRQLSMGNSQKVAVELAKPDFDINSVNTMIDSFTTGPDSVAAKGGTVLKEFYAKLTPDERKLLAKSIGDRAARMQQPQ